jgi:hypothetical protein
MAESTSIRRLAVSRTVLTVSPHEGGWAVEHEGVYSDASESKEEAKASATKQARRLTDGGTACQVIVSGDVGYFVRPGYQAAAR